MSTAESAVQETLSAIDDAATGGKLSQTAVENLRCWLTEDRYAEYRDQIVDHVRAGKWQALDDAFWTIIPFGTGGRRGRMYPIGSNAINDRTIGESAQGLADYVVEYSHGKQDLSCAIAYDTRHRSRHFAELCAGVMVAAGLKVYFLDDYRATPQLSFAVRYKHCDCGIMVTASHNPPSDNAVKVYWSSGAQVLPPHDKAIIDRVMNCQQIKITPFAEAVAAGKIEMVTKEIDDAFLEAVSACGFAGPREAKILYSPLHGVGAAAVMPLLARDGFSDVEVYGPHAEQSGDFPNVPGHVSNPENQAVFDQPIEYAKERGFDVILATDPDCDRLGVAAPKTALTTGPWGTFNGNQIGVMLADFVLRKRQAAGTLSPEHFVVTTLVTTGMIRRIAENYGVRFVGDLLVGFKYIAEATDREGPDKFVFGTRGVARLRRWRILPRQGRRCRLHAAVRIGGGTEVKRADAARLLGRSASPIWLSLRKDVEPDHGGKRRNGGDETVDAIVSLASAQDSGGHRRRASARLFDQHDDRLQRWQYTRLGRTGRRFGHHGFGRRWKLRGGKTQRHRAEDQTVRVHSFATGRIGRFVISGGDAEGANGCVGERLAGVCR